MTTEHEHGTTPPPVNTVPEPFESEHFTLTELAHSVWAAIVKPGGLAASNAGIINLGDRTLIFDMTLTPAAGRDLVRAAEHLTGRPPAVAINSHFHADHVQGNQALPPGTPLLSTTRTRELVLENQPRSIADRRKRLPQEIADAQEQLQAEDDPAARQAMAERLLFLRRMQDEAAHFKVRAPTITFQSHITLHGSDRLVEVLSYGGGHTASDAFLWLPEERILFAADLLFYQLHAWAGDGNPREWLRILEQIERLEPGYQTIVPGHGAIAPRDGFEGQSRYLADLVAALDELRAQEATPDEAAATPVPDAYRAWDGAERWGNNLRVLFQQS